MEFHLDVRELDNLVMLIDKLPNEKERRVLLNGAAKVYGYGGLGRIKSLTNIAYSTLKNGSDVNDAKNIISEFNSRK